MELLWAWLLCPFLGAAILSRYNKAGIGFLLGLIFGPIGVLFTLVMRSNEGKKEEEKRHAEQMQTLESLKNKEKENKPERECPYCAETILAKATVCKHCGRDVMPVNTTALVECRTCGAQNSIEWKTCQQCGARIEKASNTTEKLAGGDVTPINTATVIKCRACGAQVSSELKRCPHCGAKVKRLLSAAEKLVVLLICATIVIVGVLGRRSPTREGGASPTHEKLDHPKQVAETRIINSEFKAGPVLITVRGKCEPDSPFSVCDSNVVMRYAKEALTINNVTRPISESDVSWVANRYVTINYTTGGNCWACEGIHAAALDNGKLFYLGEFGSFKDGYLIKPYSELELNNITGHADAPSWLLYFKYAGGKAVLDMNKTCATAQTRYAVEKDDLLRTLARERTVDTPPNWIEQNVKPALLSTLALAKYCGFQNDFRDILNSAKSNRELATPETLQKLEVELAKVQAFPAKAGDVHYDSKGATGSSAPPASAQQLEWNKSATLKGTFHSATFVNCCQDGKATEQTYYFIRLENKADIINEKNDEFEPAMRDVQTIQLSGAPEMKFFRNMKEGQQIIVTCPTLVYGATGHYALPAYCGRAEVTALNRAMIDSGV